MTGINKFDGKDKRRQRLRNHVARDLKSDKYFQRVVPDRRRKEMNDNQEYYFEEVYYDDTDSNS